MIGSKRNLSEWVEKFTDEMYSWALHKVSDVELARDLVQDTFLAASEKIETFKGESSPKTWLFAILNHKIIDVYRKKAGKEVKVVSSVFSKFFNENDDWKQERLPSDWDDDDNLLDNYEFQAVLQKCFEALPEKWNACVKMKFLMGKKGNEICQELEIAPTNFWQMVHRAKLQLRDCVEINWFKV